MSQHPQTIQIYLPKGNPRGLRIAEIINRTVRLFEVPRPLLADFFKLDESKQVGVYFLIRPLSKLSYFKIADGSNESKA